MNFYEIVCVINSLADLCTQLHLSLKFVESSAGKTKVELENLKNENGTLRTFIGEYVDSIGGGKVEEIEIDNKGGGYEGTSTVTKASRGSTSKLRLPTRIQKRGGSYTLPLTDHIVN